MTQVFISYSRKDLAFVERLAKKLRNAGLDVWYDLSDLEVGTRWGKEIQKAIQQSRYFIVVLSPNSTESEWVEREFLYADNHNLKIVPLVYKSCDMPMWSLNLHYIDMRGGNYRSHFPELLKALDLSPETSGKPEEPVVVETPTVEAVGLQEAFDREEAERESKIKAAREKEKQAAAEKSAWEKARREQARLEKQAREQERRHKWKLFLVDFRHKMDMFKNIRPYGLPVLFGSILVVGLVYFTAVYLPRNIPAVESAPSLFTTGTLITTTTLVPSPNPTITFSPLPSLVATITALPTPDFPPDPSIGSTWTSPKDGMVLVYVPEGEFNMGHTDFPGDPGFVHTVYLDAYWIDRTEVTNGMYSLCILAGVCRPPASSASSTHSEYFGNSQYVDYPVINVTWTNALSYCAWARRRLPTEAEWEKAARGTEGRNYPWGNGAPNMELANYNSNVGDTTRVGQYPQGASPYGALDLAGNVAEFVHDAYMLTYYQTPDYNNPQGPAHSLYGKVFRGGSWNDPEDNLYSFKRSNNFEGSWNNLGFRCALSP